MQLRRQILFRPKNCSDTRNRTKKRKRAKMVRFSPFLDSSPFISPFLSYVLFLVFLNPFVSFAFNDSSWDEANVARIVKSVDRDHYFLIQDRGALCEYVAKGMIEEQHPESMVIQGLEYGTILSEGKGSRLIEGEIDFVVFSPESHYREHKEVEAIYEVKCNGAATRDKGIGYAAEQLQRAHAKIASSHYKETENRGWFEYLDLESMQFLAIPWGTVLFSDRDEDSPMRRIVTTTEPSGWDSEDEQLKFDSVTFVYFPFTIEDFQEAFERINKHINLNKRYIKNKRKILKKIRKDYDGKPLEEAGEKSPLQPLESQAKELVKNITKKRERESEITTVQLKKDKSKILTKKQRKKQRLQEIREQRQNKYAA